MKPSLFRWYSRRLRAVSSVAILLALVGVLFLQQQPFGVSQAEHALPWLFIIIHSLGLNWQLGRISGRWDAFLYTRGFSRDTLFVHRSLALVFHLLIVWVLVSLAIWTGMRSWVQNRLLNNPEFPLMDGLDACVPLFWLIGYFVTISILQFATIRRAQPTRNAAAGIYLAVAVFFACFTFQNMSINKEWAPLFIILVLIVITSASIWGSWLLHRRVEVQS